MSIDEMQTASSTEPLDLHAAAVRRLKGKREFVGHLIAYGTVNGLIIAVWAVLGAAFGWWFPWFVFPLLGWGIGLVFHGWATYGPPSRPFSQAAIDREMHRLGQR
jgi:hypothetical protein